MTFREYLDKCDDEMEKAVIKLNLARRVSIHASEKEQLKAYQDLLDSEISESEDKE